MIGSHPFARNLFECGMLTLLLCASSVHAQHQQNPINKAVTKQVSTTIFGPPVAELKPAAEAGDATAQFQLGKAYRLGGDFTNSVYWLRKAAKQGLADAQFEYGNTFIGYYPPNVPKDDKEAVRWISLAAHQNLPQAQLSLAQHLEKGTHGKPDLVEAMTWLTILVNNRPEYQVYVDQLALKLSTEQIAYAQKRASLFKPSPPTIVGPEFKLQGISGSGERKLAIINGRTFARSERGKVKSDGGDSIEIECMVIGTGFVVIQVIGEKNVRRLAL